MNLLLISLILVMTSCQNAYRLKPNAVPASIEHRQSIKLVTPDGEAIALYELLTKNQATVFIFWQAGCPCVKRYQERVQRLFHRYGDRGLSFYYLSSNTDAPIDEVFDQFIKRSIEVPVLKDEGGVLAKRLHIKGTPAAAVIDGSGQVVFTGWIDNERHEGERHRIAYLENAIKNLLNQEPVRISTSPMFGCPIR